MSQSHSNTAAYLTTKQQTPFSLAKAPMPEPGPHEILIKVSAIAINPVDAAIQEFGILWDSDAYPLIIGEDLAGQVVGVGVGVSSTRMKVGDRVLACVESGAFQQYCIARTELVAKIPEHVSYAEASVLGLGMATAAVGLFQPDGMGLEMPKLDVAPNGKIVLVWGGSSSVGSCATQMLRAAGYEVVAVAGGSNKQYCLDLGAKYVSDHRSGDVEEEIVAGIHASGKEFAGVFSAIIDMEVVSTCVRLADQLGRSDRSRIVGTVIPPGGPFPLPEVPDGVKFAFCKGAVDLLPESRLAKVLGWEKRSLMTNVGPALFEEWMSAALDCGQLKCMPQPFVVGHGLESLQGACDLMAKGVSAKKLVVLLD